MNMIDVYPEILRATHTELVEALIDAGIPGEPAAEIALQVVEYIRKNWGGRTLTRVWWMFDGRGDERCENEGENTGTLPGVQARIDPVKSVRGRELRAIAWGILVFLEPRAQRPKPCRIAAVIAATVERCLALGVIYIPKGEEVERAIRDREVWRKFKWLGNIDQVIAKSGLAQSQLYAIKRRLQKEHEDREQPPLPGL